MRAKRSKQSEQSAEVTTRFGNREEVIAREHSRGWDREMPAILITYPSGSMDLHCQTGDHHEKAIAAATAILKARGLAVSRAEMMGCTGLYYSVSREA